MIIKVNYTVSDIYMSTSVSAVYIKVVYSGVSAGGGGTWGTITGTLSSQTDLQSALDAKVPYTGATGAVNLGAFGITAASLIKSGGTSAQFLKADGSVDSSTYVPTSRTLTINGVTQDLSADRTFTIATPNIYNADGTLTGSRIVTSGGFPLTFTGTNTAASLIARGLNLTHTLVASANNDVLVGLDINPTFTNGAFTNVTNAGVRVKADNYNFVAEASTTGAFYTGFHARNTLGKSGFLIQGSSIDGSGHANATVLASYNGNLNLCAGFDVGNSGNYFMRFSTGGYSMPYSERMRLTAAGRLLLGTTTESTFLLDVNGTARVSSTLTMRDILDPLGSESVIIRGVHPTGYNGSIVIAENLSKTSGYGQGNVIMNTKAQFINLTGTFNSLLGAAAGSILTTGSYNVMIGAVAGVNVTTNSHSTYIGSLSTGIAANGNATIQITAGVQPYSEGVTTDMYPTNQNYAFIGGGYYANEQIQHFYFGAAPFLREPFYPEANKNINFYAPSASQVTDKSGGNFIINAGRGTGTGASGDIIFSTATILSTGTTLQSLISRWWVKGSRGTLSNVAFPNASAQVQIDSSNQGFLPPRMTTTQINAIASPAEGLMAYNTTISHMCVYQAGAWAKLNHSPM